MQFFVHSLLSFWLSTPPLPLILLHTKTTSPLTPLVSCQIHLPFLPFTLNMSLGPIPSTFFANVLQSPGKLIQLSRTLLESILVYNPEAAKKSFCSQVNFASHGSYLKSS